MFLWVCKTAHTWEIGPVYVWYQPASLLMVSQVVSLNCRSKDLRTPMEVVWDAFIHSTLAACTLMCPRLQSGPPTLLIFMAAITWITWLFCYVSWKSLIKNVSHNSNMWIGTPTLRDCILTWDRNQSCTDRRWSTRAWSFIFSLYTIHVSSCCEWCHTEQSKSVGTQ